MGWRFGMGCTNPCDICPGVGVGGPDGYARAHPAGAFENARGSAGEAPAVAVSQGSGATDAGAGHALPCANACRVTHSPSAH